jgi:hypothetical protein
MGFFRCGVFFRAFPLVLCIFAQVVRDALKLGFLSKTAKFPNPSEVNNDP